MFCIIISTLKVARAWTKYRENTKGSQGSPTYNFALAEQIKHSQGFFVVFLIKDQFPHT